MNDTFQEAIPLVAPLRVGVILDPLKEMNKPALQYLIVHLNTRQRLFEFELHSADSDDPLVTLLTQVGPVSDDLCRDMLPDFNQRLLKKVAAEQEGYTLGDRSLPEVLVVVSQVKFTRGYYSVSAGPVAVQALGNWDRSMAPPSIYEFILTLLIRQSAGMLVPSMSESIHLGTKGCVFDFTPRLAEARYKALQSFVCSVCQQRLRDANAGFVAGELVRVLDTKWLGRLRNPYSPAAIVAKLGYNLFLTKGPRPTWRESVLASLRDAGVKEFLRLVTSLLLAGLLLWLGLKARPAQPSPAPVQQTPVSDTSVKKESSTPPAVAPSTTTTAPATQTATHETAHSRKGRKAVPYH